MSRTKRILAAAFVAAAAVLGLSTPAYAGIGTSLGETVDGVGGALVEGAGTLFE